MTTLVVDDEPLAREGLRMLLAGEKDAGPIYEAKDGREAVAAIRDLHPDLVFLDVQMPEMDGIAVVKEIGVEEMPFLVFVTAYDQYAIQAFEINAVDYLLKPVTEQRFRETLTRARQRMNAQPAAQVNRELMALLETIGLPKRYVKRLAVRSAGKTVFVDVEDIEWIQAAENYVELHVGRANHLVHAGMNTLEKSLDPEVFLRVHRSAMVNVKCIKEIQSVLHGEYAITLDSGMRLQSGRLYGEKLRTLIANPF